jgi:hypothetical protein
MIENNEVKFPMGSVPISIVAKVYGKDPNWVRAGIIGGWLPIGTATRHALEGRNIGYMSKMLNLRPCEIQTNINEMLYVLLKQVGKREYLKTMFMK